MPEIIYDPATGELISLRTGEVVGQYEESPSETYSKRILKALRGHSKAGMAERLQLGTVLTPREQIRLNKRLGLRKYQNAPKIRRTLRSKGLAAPTEVLLNPLELEVLRETIAEDMPFEIVERPEPEPVRRAESLKWLEGRRKRMLDAIQRAEETA